jgi:hypothetical protein
LDVAGGNIVCSGVLTEVAGEAGFVPQSEWISEKCKMNFINSSYTYIITL